MPKTYSTYEAKARLSELLDRVRKGDIVTITHRGKPVAEVRPVEDQQETMAARLDHLRRNGIVSKRSEDHRKFKPLGARKGALQRFIESRE